MQRHSGFLLLFVLLFNFLCGLESVNVYVTVSECPSNADCNCSYMYACPPRSNLTVICPKLISALEIWTKCLEIDEVIFTLHSNQTLGPASYVFGRGKSANLIIPHHITIEGNGHWINCNLLSVFFFVRCFYITNTVLHKCGATENMYIRCYRQSCIHLVNVTFYASKGLSIINAANVTIESSVFTNSLTTPDAALKISYDFEFISAHVNVTLKNCSFLSNSEDHDLSAVKGSSGVLSVSFSDINLHSQNITVTILSCLFQENNLQASAIQSPMFYMQKISNSDVSVSVEDCRFINNTMSVIVEIVALDNGRVSMAFVNNSFNGNVNPIITTGKNGLLTVSIDNPSQSTIEYDQLQFEVNYGTLLYVYSNGYSNHTLTDCSFIGNYQTMANPTMLSFMGSPDFCDSHYYTGVTLNNLTFVAGVQDDADMPFKSNRSIVFVTFVELIAENLYLRGSETSIATMMVLDTVHAVFIGNNTFHYNTGVYGGALAVRSTSSVTIAVDSVLTFSNNYADYGGALYFDTMNVSEVLNCFGNITFYNDNHANIAGDLLYSTTPDIKLDYLGNCFNSTQGISTAPKSFSISDKILSLIPGQVIKLNVTLLDGLGKPTSCKAQVNLMCTYSNDSIPCETVASGLWLIGLPDIFLHGERQEVNTLLYVISKNNITVDLQPSLSVRCLEKKSKHKVVNININWSPECLLGFTMTESKICNCSINNKIRCTDDGIACLQEGLWSNHNGSVIINCPYPLCYQKRISKRSTICQNYYGQFFVALPQTNDADQQCAFNRGGMRCSGCQENYFFTFGGIKCTNDCKEIYVFLITLFAVIIQFSIFIVILVAVRLKLEIGSGFLYGPLLFLAILSQMHFGYYNRFTNLKLIAKSVSSIFLVNLEILGEIPWCFGYSLNLLTIQTLFYYLGPFLVWAMLLLLVAMGHRCPRLLSKVQDSPVQAICLLMMLSFWSVASTSIKLLIPLKINNEYYTEVNPSVRYFHDEHIPVALVAISILSLVIIPFIGTLAVSNFKTLYYLFRLYRLKPLIDECQSCYRDKYRWYSVVYYIFWLLYLVLASYPSVTYALLALLLTLHFIVQPYKRHILNVIDTLLLLDLLFLTSLLFEADEVEDKNTYHTVLIYVLTLLPLAYVMFGCVGIFLMQCRYRTYKNLFRSFGIQRLRNQTVTPTPSSSAPLGYNEREPLIIILSR